MADADGRDPGPCERFLSSETRSFLLTFAACAAIIVVRNPDAVFRAEFWAEDATEYFFGSLTMGLRSLVTPVWGYHCFFARSVAWVATLLPVAWTPTLYAVVSLIVSAAVSAAFTRDGFSWIIPSRPFRMLVCLALAVGPGTSEVFLNLCNLHSVLALAALLLLLAQPLPMGRLRIALFVLLLCSSVFTVLWAPVVALLWYRTRHRSYGALLLCMAAVLLINATGTHSVSGEARLLNYGHLWRIPKILVENLFLRLFFMPFLGDSITVTLMRDVWMFWPAAAGAAAAALLLLPKARSMDRALLVLLGLAFLCAVGSLGPIAVSRSYTAGQLVRESGVTWWWHRYSYLPGMVGLLFWFSLSSSYLKTRPSDLKGLAAALAVFLLVLNNAVEWNSGYRRDDVHWPQAAPALQAALDQRRRGELREPAVFTDIRWVHPVGWKPSHGELKLVLSPR